LEQHFFSLASPTAQVTILLYTEVTTWAYRKSSLSTHMHTSCGCSVCIIMTPLISAWYGKF